MTSGNKSKEINFPLKENHFSYHRENGFNCLIYYLIRRNDLRVFELSHFTAELHDKRRKKL